MMDISAAKELKNSSLWREVEKEIDFRVNTLMKKLLTCETKDLMEVRTKIQALEECKNIPTTVIERDA
jgi:hypothetical protein